MQTPAAADLDVVETLDEVARLHVIRVEAESRIFELAAHFADLHPAESLLPSTVPGGERAVRLGGVGTPRMAEFAYAELGARMQMSTWSARRLVADALDVRHRLPEAWARVQRREARVAVFDWWRPRRGTCRRRRRSASTGRWWTSWTAPCRGDASRRGSTASW